jgi:cytochrome c oxidase subunit 3
MVCRGFLVGVVFFYWQRDIVRERLFQGNHSSLVQRGLKWGLVWFLFRETCFFFRIFWAYFHYGRSPLTRGLRGWPLFGREAVPAFQVPLLNTVILVIRGATATLGHQDILRGKKSEWILFRGILGLYFIRLQGIEYYFRSFRLASGSFGRVFFFGTGFHGIHVTLGLLILAIRHLRINQISMAHHFGLEFSLWYWHFVDVVWLFLFTFVYIWGS